MSDKDDSPKNNNASKADNKPAVANNQQSGKGVFRKPKCKKPIKTRDGATKLTRGKLEPAELFKEFEDGGENGLWDQIQQRWDQMDKAE